MTSSCLKQNTYWGRPIKARVSFRIISQSPSLVRFVALMGASRPSLPLGTQGRLPECPEFSNSTQLIHRSQVGSTGRRRRRWRRLYGDGAAGLPVGPIRPEHQVELEPEWQPRILQVRGPRPRPGGPLGLGQFAHWQKSSAHSIMIELPLLTHRLNPIHLEPAAA